MEYAWSKPSYSLLTFQQKVVPKPKILTMQTSNCLSVAVLPNQISFSISILPSLTLMVTRNSVFKYVQFDCIDMRTLMSGRKKRDMFGCACVKLPVKWQLSLNRILELNKQLSCYYPKSMKPSVFLSISSARWQKLNFSSLFLLAAL